MRTTGKQKASDAIKERQQEARETRRKTPANFKTVVSTGSTLLDLAISGGIIRGGGIPSGILVEIFGPSGSGKTVMLCQIAGAIQRQGGQVLFNDPEARLNNQFAKMFGLAVKKKDYKKPDTVTEVFKSIRDWEPEDPTQMNGIFTDSLAALSTDLEMENKEGDKMGMRRAKEFSEELRKTCRILAQKNQLLVCSNQVRVNTDAGPYGQRYTTPGGMSVEFYSSLRLRFLRPEKVKQKVKVNGKEVTRVIGVESVVEVAKSSIDKPYRTAPVIILFDYGIDDIQANLQYIKDYTKATVYMIGDEKLDVSIMKSVQIIEDRGLENQLREQVIDLWESIEKKFTIERKNKYE